MVNPNDPAFRFEGKEFVARIAYSGVWGAKRVSGALHSFYGVGPSACWSKCGAVVVRIVGQRSVEHLSLAGQSADCARHDDRGCFDPTRIRLARAASDAARILGPGAGLVDHPGLANCDRLYRLLEPSTASYAGVLGHSCGSSLG